MLITPSPNRPNAAAFAELANADFTYDWERGPWQVRSLNDAKVGGLNCIAYGHLLIRNYMGVSLPPEFHGNEMVMDLNGAGRILRPVASYREAQPGDMVFTGLQRRSDAQRRFSAQYNDDGHMTNSFDSGFRHMAIVTNEIDPLTGEFMVTDISMDAGTRTTSLYEVMDFEQHSHLYGIGRLVVASEYNISRGEAA